MIARLIKVAHTNNEIVFRLKREGDSTSSVTIGELGELRGRRVE